MRQQRIEELLLIPALSQAADYLCEGIPFALHERIKQMSAVLVAFDAWEQSISPEEASPQTAWTLMQLFERVLPADRQKVITPKIFESAIKDLRLTAFDSVNRRNNQSDFDEAVDIEKLAKDLETLTEQIKKINPEMFRNLQLVIFETGEDCAYLLGKTDNPSEGSIKRYSNIQNQVSDVIELEAVEPVAEESQTVVEPIEEPVVEPIEEIPDKTEAESIATDIIETVDAQSSTEVIEENQVETVDAQVEIESTDVVDDSISEQVVVEQFEVENSVSEEIVEIKEPESEIEEKQITETFVEEPSAIDEINADVLVEPETCIDVNESELEHEPIIEDVQLGEPLELVPPSDETEPEVIEEEIIEPVSDEQLSIDDLPEEEMVTEVIESEVEPEPVIDDVQLGEPLELVPPSDEPEPEVFEEEIVEPVSDEQLSIDDIPEETVVVEELLPEPVIDDVHLGETLELVPPSDETEPEIIEEVIIEPVSDEQLSIDDLPEEEVVAKVLEPEVEPEPVIDDVHLGETLELVPPSDETEPEVIEEEIVEPVSEDQLSIDDIPEETVVVEELLPEPIIDDVQLGEPLELVPPSDEPELEVIEEEIVEPVSEDQLSIDDIPEEEVIDEVIESEVETEPVIEEPLTPPFEQPSYEIAEPLVWNPKTDEVIIEEPVPVYEWDPKSDVISSDLAVPSDKVDVVSQIETRTIIDKINIDGYGFIAETYDPIYGASIILFPNGLSVAPSAVSDLLKALESAYMETSITEGIPDLNAMMMLRHPFNDE